MDKRHLMYRSKVRIFYSNIVKVRFMVNFGDNLKGYLNMLWLYSFKS